MSEAGRAERPAPGEDAALVDLAATGTEAQEFLLAARPRLVGGTVWLSALLLGAFLAWASWSRMDVVVTTAPGIVRPRGDVQPVHAPVTGTVTDVRVREGALVAKGEVLLAFDPAPLKIELEKLRGRIAAKAAERTRAEAMLGFLGKSHDAKRATLDSDVAQAEVEVKLQRTKHDFAVQQADALLASAEAELVVAQSRAAEAKKEDDRARERLREAVITGKEAERIAAELQAARAALGPAEKSVATRRLAHSQAREDVTDVKLADGRLARLRRAGAELEADHQVEVAKENARTAALAADAQDLDKEREAAELRLSRVEVRASVSGLVTRLAVTSPGRHVAEGATVAEIAPAGRDLVLEAYASNTSRGDLREGLKAKLRFAAFSYQEWGAVDGTVSEISKDAVRAPSDAPQGTSREPVYRLTITLATDEVVNHEGKRGRIELGMAAQADLVVDDQPLLFLLVSELRKVFDPKRPG